MEDEEMPMFKCFPREQDTRMLQFWCPFCRKFHKHGRGPGHRAAHCVGTSSPLNKTGYIVVGFNRRFSATRTERRFGSSAEALARHAGTVNDDRAFSMPDR